MGLRKYTQNFDSLPKEFSHKVESPITPDNNRFKLMGQKHNKSHIDRPLSAFEVTKRKIDDDFEKEEAVSNKNLARSSFKKQKTNRPMHFKSQKRR